MEYKTKEILDTMTTMISGVEQEHNIKIHVAFLYGSQNYGLDNENSDIDIQAYVLPTWDDILRNKKFNKEYHTEHGNIIVKDIREFGLLISKMNPTVLETLFTDYVYTDGSREAELLLVTVEKNREKIIWNDLQTLYWTLRGTIMNKYKSLFKKTNLTTNEIETFGYSPKNFSHMYRYFDMLRSIHEIHALELDKGFGSVIRMNRVARHETKMMKQGLVFLDSDTIAERGERVKAFADNLLYECEDRKEYFKQFEKRDNGTDFKNSDLKDLVNIIELSIKESILKELIGGEL